MKKLTLVLCFISISSLLFSQIPILEENFNYPAGDSLGAHGWIHFSPNTITSPRLSVTSPGLLYTGYNYSGIGNSATLTFTGNQDSYKPLDSAVSGGSVYVSFMVRVDTAKAAGDYFMSFLPNSSLTNFQARCYVRRGVTANNLSFGISKTTAAAGGIFYSDSIYSPETTYVIVLKYKFNNATNTDDEVSLFVFSSGFNVSEPSTPTVGPVTGTGTDSPNLGRLVLRQSTSSSSTPLLSVDGISASMEWSGALPVELSSFSSSVSGNQVDLFWSTISEINNYGFDIERKEIGANMHGKWNKVGFVNGYGTIQHQKDYYFNDNFVKTGTYNYRIKQIDYNGNFEYFELADEVVIAVPDKPELSQNFPNPFNPVTLINYQINGSSKVNLKVYDNSGKDVAVLVNEYQTAGSYSVRFNGENLSSGIYFYVLEIGGVRFETKSMVLLR